MTKGDKFSQKFLRYSRKFYALISRQILSLTSNTTHTQYFGGKQK
jgi:hypothetical protein